MTPIPDCPNCESNHSLRVERVEPRGVRVCWCDVCGKQCRVDAQGAIVHLPDRRDLQGVMMDAD